MKIGFIGCGNMASAIISGIISSKVIDSGDINAYDVYAPAVEKNVKKYGVNACESEKDTVKKSDIVILAVKPNVLGSVLDKINTALEESDTLIISIAAGKTLSFIRDALSHDNRIIRVMPNINAVAHEAMSAYVPNKYATEDDCKECESIFGAIGKIIKLEEKFFPVFGVIGGSAPAFAYLFIDSLARAGVKNGMAKDTALMVAAQTVLGSAKMLIEASPDEHPWELIDKVCSPGGTTIEGITSLQNDRFEASIQKAVDKAVEKDRKL